MRIRIYGVHIPMEAVQASTPLKLKHTQNKESGEIKATDCGLFQFLYIRGDSIYLYSQNRLCELFESRRIFKSRHPRPCMHRLHQSL